MAGNVMNLLVLAAGGIILADLVKNASGTSSLLQGIIRMWQISVNGMLGQTTS